jgi:uncharacterized protein DUF2490
MRLVATWCSLFLLIASAARAQDHQLWNEVDLAGSRRGVAFVAPFVARIDTRAPHVPLIAAGLTADVPLPWHLRDPRVDLTLTGGYLLVDLPARENATVHVPLVAASATFHVRRLIIADRNRFEKLVGFGTSPVRYRQRLLFDMPLDRERTWHLFADDEVFFDYSASRWNQNRLQIGAGPRFRSGVSIDVFYLQRNVTSGLPSTRVLGTMVRLPIGHPS